MEWTITNTALMIVAFPFLVLLGMILVPVIIAILSIAVWVLVIAVGVVLIPFEIAIREYHRWDYRRREKRDRKELQDWCNNNPEAIEFARENPGGIYQSQQKESS